jgi:tryptophan synthase alpha chain
MSGRISQTLSNHPPGLWPFLAAGYPDVETTEEILRRLADIPIRGVEIGFPFSDPIADGPVIQTAFTKALAAGVRVDDVFQMVGRIRPAVGFPIVAMVSASIMYRIGMKPFVDRASEAGFDGLIVPDLSLEEAPELSGAAREAGLKLCMLVAPTTPPERQRRIGQLASGFMYYVSVQGVTGARDRLPADLANHVRQVRAATSLPVLVGFGVSTAAQVREVCSVADGAIVGSAVVKRIMDCVEARRSRDQTINDNIDFVRGLAG